ncbi:hypothetical protein K502DRAFT_340093 [Neoconidiobolus thromboides FSU 785]|nr:hypothetical protein K502DRAFT_340093 [Neoconidiobolus thromboides FSU 785]
MDHREITSAFPYPPHYYKQYTTKKYEKLKKITNSNEENSKKIEIPDNLESLLPPSLPKGNSYKLFNEVWDLNEKIPPIREMGLTQLYDEAKDPKLELKRLNHYTLKQFQHAVKSLSQQKLSDNGIEKVVNNLHLTFINMHHLINQNRPLEAMETLKEMYVDRTKRFRESKEFIENEKKKVLKNIGSISSFVEKKRRPFQYLIENNQTNQQETSTPNKKSEIVSLIKDLKPIDQDLPPLSQLTVKREVTKLETKDVN